MNDNDNSVSYTEAFSNNNELFIEVKNHIRDYFENPMEYSHRTLICRRINGNISSLKISLDELIEAVFKSAEERCINSGKNVYLMNVGSSGSHWVEAMLAEIDNIEQVNEVYFPPKLRNALKKYDSIYRLYMMNAVHLIHLYEFTPEKADSIIVNSAHGYSLNYYEKNDPNSLRILLKRDPLKIVESRTFRKQSYRKKISPLMDDDEYLDSNISKVIRWYSNHPEDAFHFVTSYEDFFESAEPALTSLLQNIEMELNISDEEVSKAVYLHDRNTIKQHDRKKRTNLYRGGEVTFSKSQRRLAEDALREIREEFGYLS